MGDHPEVQCSDCGWEGEASELDDGACPQCGSKDGPEDWDADGEGDA